MVWIGRLSDYLIYYLCVRGFLFSIEGGRLEIGIGRSWAVVVVYSDLCEVGLLGGEGGLVL